MEFDISKIGDLKKTRNIDHKNEMYDYYIGNHKILERKDKPDVDLSNNKILVNHAKYITDVNVGYLMGNAIDYQVNNNVNIDEVKRAYANQVIELTDVEIARAVSIFGSVFEYTYTNEELEPKSIAIDPRNGYVEYDDTVDKHIKWGCFWSGDKKQETVTYCDTEKVITYYFENEKLIDTDETVHMFHVVPMIEYINNKEKKGDFCDVTTLIDAINLLQSDRVNDKEQLVSAILAIYGGTLEDEDMESIKKDRVMFIPEGADARYLVKSLQEADAETLKKSLLDDLHKISMTPNMSDENFVGNSSGVALSYKLLAFEQNTLNKERYMQRGLAKRLEIYINFFSSMAKMQNLYVSDIDIVFKRNLPTNKLETAQIMQTLQGILDDETIIGMWPDVKDASNVLEELNKQKEKNKSQFFFNDVNDEE